VLWPDKEMYLMLERCGKSRIQSLDGKEPMIHCRPTDYKRLVNAFVELRGGKRRKRRYS
jgi:hypothetical protein